MAGNLPVPNAAEVKIVWGLSGSPEALTILHYTHPVGATMTQAQADTLGAAVKAAFGASGLAALMWTGMSLMRVETRHMDSNSDPWFSTSTPPVAGTSAANPLPAATSFVVSLKTGLRGRSFNGRVYLWGYTEDANDAAGGISAGGSTASTAFITQIQGMALSGGTYALGVLTRWTTPPGAPPGTPPTERTPPIVTPVTSVSARDTRWDVQRRRAIPGI